MSRGREFDHTHPRRGRSPLRPAAVVRAKKPCRGEVSGGRGCRFRKASFRNPFGALRAVRSCHHASGRRSAALRPRAAQTNCAHNNNSTRRTALERSRLPGLPIPRRGRCPHRPAGFRFPRRGRSTDRPAGTVIFNKVRDDEGIVPYNKKRLEQKKESLEPAITYPSLFTFKFSFFTLHLTPLSPNHRADLFAHGRPVQAVALH